LIGKALPAPKSSLAFFAQLFFQFLPNSKIERWETWA